MNGECYAKTCGDALHHGCISALRFGLRYSSDFADWQHLNVKGSVTFSKKLGADLRTGLSIPDRRGDARYASYDACAQTWFEKYPFFESSGVEGNE